MRHEFLELRDHETGRAVLINLDRVTYVNETAEKASRVHITGADETVTVRESVAQILEKLPHSSGWGG